MRADALDAGDRRLPRRLHAHRRNRRERLGRRSTAARRACWPAWPRPHRRFSRPPRRSGAAVHLRRPRRRRHAAAAARSTRARTRAARGRARGGHRCAARRRRTLRVALTGCASAPDVGTARARSATTGASMPDGSRERLSASASERARPWRIVAVVDREPDVTTGAPSIAISAHGHRRCRDRPAGQRRLRPLRSAAGAVAGRDQRPARAPTRSRVRFLPARPDHAGGTARRRPAGRALDPMVRVP